MREYIRRTKVSTDVLAPLWPTFCFDLLLSFNLCDLLVVVDVGSTRGIKEEPAWSEDRERERVASKSDYL